MDSLVFDTVVGVIFVFAVFAFAVSGVVEGVSRLVGLRAEFLLRGVSSLLDDNTTFDKGWIPKLVKSAEKAQDEATDTAIGDALDQIGDKPQGPLVQVKAALTDARQLVAPWKPVAESETALEESKAAAKAASSAEKKAAKGHVEARKTALAAAEQAPENHRSDGPGAALLTNAATTLKAADDALDAEAAALAQTPPPTDAADRKELLAEARRLLEPARQARKYATGEEQAVTVVSIMTQPVVDLTAALKIPQRVGELKHPSWKTKWNLPSYVSAHTFSTALMHTLVPDPATGKTTIPQLQGAIDQVGNKKLRRVLQGHLDTAEAKVDSFRKEVEKWYDDHMDRVSGWYKRHTRWYILGVAAVLAVGFNINAVAMAQAFYSDQALRESVVKLAFDTADCQGKADAAPAATPSATPSTAPTPTTGATPEPASDAKTPATCLQDVRKQIDDLRGNGLPIGWGTVAACQVDGSSCSRLNKFGLTSLAQNAQHRNDTGADLRQLLLVVLGWFVVAVSALMGARFWFDLLTKLGSARSAGPKPKKAA